MPELSIVLCQWVLDAMQWICQWTAAFDYEDLDKVITDMQLCNAFEKSRVQHKLLSPPKA